jgi:hypothetical protein
MADFARFTRPPEEWDEEMWRVALKSVVRFGAEPYEDLEDVVSAGWLLGKRRAGLLDRDFWPGIDATYPLSVLCWWPFKPLFAAETREYIKSRRWELVQGVHQSGDIERLNSVVSDEVLRMGLAEFSHRTASGGVQQLQQLLRFG